jgi:hypothetical protein
MKHLQASNEWAGVFGVVAYFRRYPWTLAFLILFAAMLIGFYRDSTISSDQEAEREVRRAENLARDKQFCRAIPNTAVAGAQALINVVIAQARVDGANAAELTRIKKQGANYTQEARRLALEQLPECPKILVTRPQDSP